VTNARHHQRGTPLGCPFSVRQQPGSNPLTLAIAGPDGRLPTFAQPVANGRRARGRSEAIASDATPPPCPRRHKPGDPALRVFGGA